MIRSLLLGAVAGARSITPLAAIAAAASRDALAGDNGAPGAIGRAPAAGALLLLALGELAGDKWSGAPDRIVAAGMAARLISGAVAGASVAPRDRRLVAGALGAAAAVAAAYLTFDLRMRALRRYGQVASGLAEDALVLGATWLIMRGAGSGDAARGGSAAAG